MIDISRILNAVYRHPAILAFIALMIVTGMVFVHNNFAMGVHGAVDEKKLYVYSSREIFRFFEDMGYKDLYYNSMAVSRNSDGTALRFINGRKKKGIVAGCDGSIMVVDIPGDLAWLNDANQVIVWVTWIDNKSVTHYANGTSEKSSFFPAHGPDPSGKYFIKERTDLAVVPLNESCYTTIYSTRRPFIPLVKADICGAVKIFYKNNKVYLTGKQLRDGKWQEEEIRIFQHNTENALEQIDRIIVPKPDKSLRYFYAEDLNPCDDEMLFIDTHDFPSRSVWYSFNLKTRQLNKVDKVPRSGAQAFYLQCDIVKKVTDELKKRVPSGVSRGGRGS
ncbi:MAG: hypothetical protein AB1746_16470 [Candidatus Zixiibacteriota bacterium]